MTACLVHRQGLAVHCLFEVLKEEIGDLLDEGRDGRGLVACCLRLPFFEELGQFLLKSSMPEELVDKVVVHLEFIFAHL